LTKKLWSFRQSKHIGSLIYDFTHLLVPYAKLLELKAFDEQLGRIVVTNEKTWIHVIFIWLGCNAKYKLINGMAMA
jgi:hypothetical protein